jgi:hypothetical protein
MVSEAVRSSRFAGRGRPVRPAVAGLTVQGRQVKVGSAWRRSSAAAKVSASR